MTNKKYDKYAYFMTNAFVHHYWYIWYIWSSFKCHEDPKTKATSLYTTIDIANRFRDSIKPVIKKIAIGCCKLEVKNFIFSVNLEFYV